MSWKITQTGWRCSRNRRRWWRWGAFRRFECVRVASCLRRIRHIALHYKIYIYYYDVYYSRTVRRQNKSVVWEEWGGGGGGGDCCCGGRKRDPATAMRVLLGGGDCGCETGRTYYTYIVLSYIILYEIRTRWHRFHGPFVPVYRSPGCLAATVCARTTRYTSYNISYYMCLLR